MNNNYQNNITCPIYFENHDFGGIISQVENLINYDFGFAIRTTFINSKPYFCAIDICRGLSLSKDHVTHHVMQAVNDILSQTQQNQENLTPPVPVGGSPDKLFDYELYYYIDVESIHVNQYNTEYRQIVRTLFISEPILYMLVFRSTKKEAIAFKAWLATDVLPKMRYIGKEMFMNVLNNTAMNKVVDELHNINENLSAYMGGQNTNEDNIIQGMDIINYKLDNIGYISSSIANNQNFMVGQQCQLDDKITAIASGLNTIFG